MLPIILFSHGTYAKATKDTAEMIVGKLEDVYTLGLHPGGSISDLEKELSTIIEKHNGEVIVLCDILGGTPSNITFKLKQSYENIISYTGFNLPIILELVFNRDGKTEEIKELIQTTYSSSLHEIKKVAVVEQQENIMDL